MVNKQKMFSRSSVLAAEMNHVQHLAVKFFAFLTKIKLEQK